MRLARHDGGHPYGTCPQWWVDSHSRQDSRWLVGVYTTASMNPATTLNLDAWMKGRALEARTVCHAFPVRDSVNNGLKSLMSCHYCVETGWSDRELRPSSLSGGGGDSEGRERPGRAGCGV